MIHWHLIADAMLFGIQAFVRVASTSDVTDSMNKLAKRLNVYEGAMPVPIKLVVVAQTNS